MKILELLWTGLAILLMKLVAMLYGNKVNPERREKIKTLSTQWFKEWEEV